MRRVVVGAEPLSDASALDSVPKKILLRVGVGMIVLAFVVSVAANALGAAFIRWEAAASAIRWMSLLGMLLGFLLLLLALRINWMLRIATRLASSASSHTAPGTAVRVDTAIFHRAKPRFLAASHPAFERPAVEE